MNPDQAEINRKFLIINLQREVEKRQVIIFLNLMTKQFHGFSNDLTKVKETYTKSLVPIKYLNEKYLEKLVIKLMKKHFRTTFAIYYAKNIALAEPFLNTKGPLGCLFAKVQEKAESKALQIEVTQLLTEIVIRAITNDYVINKYKLLKPQTKWKESKNLRKNQSLKQFFKRTYKPKTV